MQTIKEHFSKFWVAYLVGLILLTTFIRMVVPKSSEQGLVGNDSISSLQPGSILTKDDENSLQVIKKKQQGNLTILETKSGFDSKNNEVILDEENKVVFVKENFTYDPNHKLSQYTNKYGEPDLTLETPAISSADAAYVFLDKGVVIIAHKLDKTVEQRWSFEPSTKVAFMASWGKEMEPEGSPAHPDPLP